MNSFDYCAAPQLPLPSAAVRNVPMASAGHCTTSVVLGENEGIRVQGESLLEMRLQLIFNARRDVARIQEQVRFFYGWNPAKPDEHVFDMVVTMRDGQVIAYAVKPEIRLKSGRFLKEMQEVAWWVRHKGFADDVRILTDADIDRVALHNAQMFAVMRTSPDSEAMAAARRVVLGIPVGGGMSLRALTIETGLEARGHSLMPRLTGQTFRNTLMRGDHPAEKRACLSLEDLAFVLVRWVIDIYHNQPHDGLGGHTPLAQWEADMQDGNYPLHSAPTQRQKRLAFGLSLTRIVQKGGIRALNVNYHSGDLARWFLKHGSQAVEVRWPTVT